MNALVFWRRLSTGVHWSPEVTFYLIPDPSADDRALLQAAHGAFIDTPSHNDAVWTLAQALRHGRWSSCQRSPATDMPLCDPIDLVIVAGYAVRSCCKGCGCG